MGETSNRKQWRGALSPKKIKLFCLVIGTIATIYFGFFGKSESVTNQQQNTTQTNSSGVNVDTENQTVNNANGSIKSIEGSQITNSSEGGGNITNSGNNPQIIQENDFSKTFNNFNTPIKSNKNEFAITGVRNKSLSETLDRKRGISISPQAENKINIEYSGEIREISGSESFRYNGGYIKISTSNGCERILKSFPIHQIPENPEHVIKSEIKSIINEYVNDNIDFFAEKILECID